MSKFLAPKNKRGCLMGGRGSGGHNSKGKLRDVQCARLDVHELGREGRLKLGTRGCLFGTLRFEVAGGPDAQRLVLEFPRRSASGEPLDPIRQVIGCYWRKAHFGGRYLIFRCSECSPITRPCESRARATLENTGQMSTGLICGGSAETGLWSLVDGRSA